MISKFLLRIQDLDARKTYQNQTRARFSKLTPIAAVQMFLIAVAVEVIQRGFPHTQSSALSNTTSAVNWLGAAIMVILSLTVRKFYPVCTIVAPSLTLYCSYYICVVDLSPHFDQAYNVLVFGITLTFVILVFYGVSWIASTFSICVLFPLLMWRQGKLVLGSEDTPAVVTVRTIFLVIAYALVSYKIEKVSKIAFLSGQQAEGSFNRWLKTFDSFPEGVALLRGEEIIYSNSALKRQFNLEATRGKESILKVLKATKIKKYVKSDQTQKQRNKKDRSGSRDKHDKVVEISVQDFINGDMNADLFEVIPSASQLGSTSQTPDDNAFLYTNYEQQRSNAGNSGKRFLQLVKVSVKIGGRTEKLLIVRDESYKICLEQMMETKELMQDFTDSMVEQIDNQALFVSDILTVMQEEFISDAGKPVADECCFCMKKMRYRIRDYRDVYDIADSTFEQPDQQQINLQECLKEVHGAVQSELTRQNIEVSIALHESCPKTFSCSNDLFNQVAINLLQQTMYAVGDRGFIKINSYRKLINQAQSLVLEFDASKLLPSKAMEQMDLVRLNLANERDVRKIMSANVDLNFKIAKILCNQLGWKLEFRFKNSTRYSLSIPIVSQRPSDLTDVQARPAADYDMEESKDENGQWDPRPTTSLSRSIKQVKEKYYTQDNYAELDQIDEGTRPYSAQVPNLTQAHMRFQQIKVVKEDPQMENDIESPKNSTHTLGMDTVARNKLRNYSAVAVPQEVYLLMNFTDVYIFEEFQVKVVQTFSESDAVDKVRKSLKSQQFRYLVIDMDVQRINLKWLVTNIRDVYRSQDRVPKLQVVVTMSLLDQTLKDECALLGVKFVCPKPSTVAELRYVFQIETSLPTTSETN